MPKHMNKAIFITSLLVFSFATTPIAFAGNNHYGSNPCQPIYGGGDNCARTPQIEINKTVQNPKTFTCETGACEQLDDGEFKLTGAASLKTYITNLGEQASDAVTSQLYCNYEYPQFNELAAIKDGDILNRMDQKLSVRDYFDGNTAKDESNTLDAQQSVGQKTTTYSFAIELVDAKYATTLSCTIWLRSGDFANKQDIKIKYVPA